MSDKEIQVGDLLQTPDGKVVGEVVIVNRRRHSLWDYRVRTPQGDTIDLRKLEQELKLVDRCTECNVRPVLEPGDTKCHICKEDMEVLG